MSSACIICHKRKVRCDLATHNPCTNCKKSEVECRPYTRKRKRFTNSLSPSRRDARSSSHSQLPVDARLSSASPDGLSNAPLPLPLPLSLPVTTSGDNDNGNGTQNQIENDSNNEPVIKEESYRGRSEYLGGSVPFDENMVKPGHDTTSPKTSAADLQMLRDQGAFELPPEYIQRELINSFNKYCLPWTPIIDPKWLEEETPSMLLLQSIFLAGSRVSKVHLEYASREVFYRRAKLLFFFGGADNSLISIVSACFLHWYNPVGPEDVSTDTSGFWIRTAGAMAFQIGLHKEPPPNAKDRGLRRRLWWSLVIRDSLIATGVGRPKTINLRDSDVLPPSMNDFQTWNFQGQLFLAYCTISCHLGDTVECYLRREISRQRRVDIENAIFRWKQVVFPKLHASAALQEDAITSHHEVQQLLVMYFVILTIIHRSPTPNSVPPAASLVASSFIAGIYEEFLLRDELRYLGPVFAFYPLCAGLSLLSSYRYTQLQSTAEHELTVMKLCLQKLSERWLSAVGPLRAINKLSERIREQGPFDGPPPTLDLDTASFFEGFDMKLCKQWTSIGHSSEPTINTRAEPTCTLAELQESNEALQTFNTRPEDAMDNYNFPLDSNLDTTFGTNWEGSGFDWSGSWLLNI